MTYQGVGVHVAETKQTKTEQLNIFFYNLFITSNLYLMDKNLVQTI